MSVPAIEIPRAYNAAADFVERNILEGRADRIALRCAGRSFTYGQTAELVNRTGNALRELGAEMETRVVLLLPDSPEFVASFFGAIKIGAVPVPLNTLLRAADYEYFLNDSRAKILIAHRSLWPEVAKIRDRLHSLLSVVITGGADPGQVSFESCTAAAAPELEPARTCRDDVAFWL